MSSPSPRRSSGRLRPAPRSAYAWEALADEQLLSLRFCDLHLQLTGTEVQRAIDRLYEETRQLLEANKDRVEALTKALTRYETLDAVDVDRVMKGEQLTKPTVGDLLEKEQSRRGTVIQPSSDPTEPDVRIGGGPIPTPG